MRVILLRHGESEANVKRIFAGYTDSPLTEKGREQAEQAALFLAWYEFEKVIASPLERAYETAVLATSLGIDGLEKHTNQAIETNDAFKEMNFGICEGFTMEEIKQQHPQLAESLIYDYNNARYPEGESLSSFYERVKHGYDAFKNDHSHTEGDYLIATHSGVIRAILSAELCGSIAEYWRFKIENCGYAVLEYTDGYAVLSELNNTIGKE